MVTITPTVFAYKVGDKYRLTEADKKGAIAALKEKLKDPYSAQWGDVKVAPRLSEVDLGSNGEKQARICVRSNSKNSYGAYTGMSYSLLLKNLDTGKFTVLFADSTGDLMCSN